MAAMHSVEKMFLLKNIPDNRTYIRKGHKSVMVWSLSLKAEIKMLLPCIFYRLGAWNGQIDQLI